VLTRRRAVALGLARREAAPGALSGAVSFTLAPHLSAAVIRNLADPAASLGVEPPGLGSEPAIAQGGELAAVALALNVAEHVAVTLQKPVALFSLEMSESELAHRFIASQARLSSDELRKGRVKGDRWPKVLKAVEKLAAAPLYVDDSSDIGILEIRSKSRRLHARQELGLVIVDYLQLMRPEGRSDSSRVEQIGQISRGLKILARELHVPVIAISQLSRAPEQRQPPRPQLSDLRESGQIEQGHRPGGRGAWAVVKVQVYGPVIGVPEIFAAPETVAV